MRCGCLDGMNCPLSWNDDRLSFEHVGLRTLTCTHTYMLVSKPDHCG